MTQTDKEKIEKVSKLFDELERMIRIRNKEIRIKPTYDPSEEYSCLLYTSPSPRDRTRSRMPSSA